MFAGRELHVGECRLHDVSPPGAEGVLRVPYVNDQEPVTGRVGEVDHQTVRRATLTHESRPHRLIKSIVGFLIGRPNGCNTTIAIEET